MSGVQELITEPEFFSSAQLFIPMAIILPRGQRRASRKCLILNLFSVGGFAAPVEPDLLCPSQARKAGL
jgi:hypothetical protein